MSIRHIAFTALALSVAFPAFAATDFPFTGKWKITALSVGPWEDPADPMVTDDEARYKGKVVEISDGSMKGPDLMGCGKTEMNIEALPFDSLFEGGLSTDPKNHLAPSDEARAKRLALELGFTTEPVPTLFQGCSEISFHKRDDKTLMFGMNNRIFTLEKQ